MRIWLVTFSKEQTGHRSVEILVNFAVRSFEELIPAIELHAQELMVLHFGHLESAERRAKIVVDKIKRGGVINVVKESFSAWLKDD